MVLLLLKTTRTLPKSSICRYITRSFHNTLPRETSGLVIGCYKKNEGSTLNLTPSAQFIDSESDGQLKQALVTSNFEGDVGSTRTFTNLIEKYPLITVCGLGEQNIEYDENEYRDEIKENIRIGVGAGAKALKSYKVTEAAIDDCGCPQSAAEGATLSTHSFEEFKSKKKDKSIALQPFSSDISTDASSSWVIGLQTATSQNLARDLMETPSNYKYPEQLALKVQKHFEGKENVKVIIRDDVWAKEKGMECFLSVGIGSIHKPKLLELHYEGDKSKPKIVLVGKGVTFDTGGISIKPSSGMGEMRGDMGGAACVIATMDAIAALNLPVNLTVLCPLAENMPSDRATKPGDVFTAMNGKTVEVDNTDAEGRMILADTLCYADEFNPSTIIDIATLTGAIDVALGCASAGTYATCNQLWNHLEKASHVTGDRLWRMPIYKYYTEQMKCSTTADLRNTQKKARSAGSATAAAFVKEFVSIKSWAHLDIAGVMSNAGDVPYLGAGMSGRPTRTLIEVVRSLSIL